LEDLTKNTSVTKFSSVHLAEFPEADKRMIDEVLERKMQKAQRISSMVLSLRKKEKIRVRQPLRRIMIPVLDKNARKDIEAVSDLIASEVNVKEVKLIDDTTGIIVKKVKPNFKVLGPKFGKDMRFVTAALQALTNEDIAKFEREGSLQIDVNGRPEILNLDDVEIMSQDIEGWLVANQGNLTVALDVNITDDLKSEGIARELVNRVQNLRKESGLEVTDRIRLSLLKDGIIESAVEKNADYIKNETLTRDLLLVDDIKNGNSIEFDDVKKKLMITLLTSK
jgi:isoleucyl-tRNA synthetase